MERSDLDFIREMLVAALNEKRDNIIGDLFKMYDQVQNRPKLPTGNINIDKLVNDMGTEYNFTLSSDYLSDGGFNTNAAGPVNIPGAFGDDVISFGDYKSQEYRPE